jgi:Protein of unknown function (DUF3237)
LEGKEIFRCQNCVHSEGPKLKGIVLRGGGGLSLIRRDEVLEVDVRLTLDTEDKHQISMAWKGLRHGPKEVMDRLYRGETTNRNPLTTLI